MTVRFGIHLLTGVGSPGATLAQCFPWKNATLRISLSVVYVTVKPFSWDQGEVIGLDVARTVSAHGLLPEHCHSKRSHLQGSQGLVDALGCRPLPCSAHPLTCKASVLTPSLGVPPPPQCSWLPWVASCFSGAAGCREVQGKG